MTTRTLSGTALGVLAVGLLIGFAARSQPGTSGLHAKASATLRASVPTSVMTTLQRACFDCHSDETRWPWYARLPIASHLIESDVKAGRGQLNWSRWADYNKFDRADKLDRACELVSERRMPPWQYRMLHPKARLTHAEITALCGWTQEEATRLVQGGS